MTSGSSGWQRALQFGDQVLERLESLGFDGPGSSKELLSKRSLFIDSVAGGRISMGGHCRLVPARDGWCAVHLPRSDDLQLLPAWLGVECIDDQVPWDEIAAAVSRRSCDEVVGAGQELGLAVSRLPEDVDEQLVDRGTVAIGRPWIRRRVGTRSDSSRVEDSLVVDLSSLWAGPLCARILSDAGARVIKVESSSRPDASRTGDPEFFDWLHRDHESQIIDFQQSQGIEELIALIERADVVIEGSRPRAFERLGIDPTRIVSEKPGKVWLSITGYGRCGPWRDRVGFGDDTAVAGGLIDVDGAGAPRFVGDAVADPLTGLLGAALVVDAVARGGGVTIDVALREVARSAAGGARLVW